MPLRSGIVSAILAAAALVSPPSTRAYQVVFTEVMYHPPGAEPEFIELFNATSTPLDIAEWRFVEGIDYTFPAFDAGDSGAHILKPKERILISSADPAATRAAYGLGAAVRVFGPWQGNLANGGETIKLTDKNGVGMATLSYGDGSEGKWPAAADGAGHTLAIKDWDRKPDDYRNWHQSAERLGTPGAEASPDPESPAPNPSLPLGVESTYINYADTWSFRDDNTDVLTNEPTWNQLGFSPGGAWKSGRGIFGFETTTGGIPAEGLPLTPITDSAAGDNHMTYYFRKEFTFTGSPLGATFSLDLVNDDGVTLFLNGTEIGRIGVATGAINWKTTASRTVGDATEEIDVLNSGNASADFASLLVSGTNVLAAVVHQTNNTSSDCVFGARLKITPDLPSPVEFNEILSGVPGGGFVEFFNPGGSPVDLQGYYLSDSAGNLAKFRIETPLVVPAGGVASVGFAAAGLTPGGEIYLTDPDGTTALRGVTDTSIGGRSIGRKPDGGAGWFLFLDPTPDATEPKHRRRGKNPLKLSEVHFAGTDVDWVEIYNDSAIAQTTAGLFLATERDFSDKVALGGPVPAHGYATWAVNFEPRGGDFALYLIDGSNRVLAARVLEQRAGLESLQTYPAGSDDWFASAAASQGSANDPARHDEIVINEVMYDPPSRESDAEFIEIYNRSGSPVSLAGWRITDGVDFVFPAGTTIPGNGFIVVGKNRAHLQSLYGGGITILGDFGGSLSNDGELIRLADDLGNTADAVDYLPSGDWPELADGDGSSMELRHPDMDNASPSAWRDSDESNKASMQNFTYTAPFEAATWLPTTTNQELYAHLVGDSHIVMANVSLKLNNSGANLVLNPGVMSPTNSSALGWVCQGTHWASFMDGGQLHLIADGHGDNKANHAEVDLANLAFNASYTLSFDAKWVSGKPRLVMQTIDHGFGTSFYIPIPDNLGTPGAPNSTLLATPAPAVTQVLHSPAVPTSADPVIVTAHVSSQEAIAGAGRRPPARHGGRQWRVAAHADERQRDRRRRNGGRRHLLRRDHPIHRPGEHRAVLCRGEFGGRQYYAVAEARTGAPRHVDRR
ncbi:MAG: lamin tail domain-containing protein [Verrucomicrobiales bacterium]